MIDFQSSCISACVLDCGGNDAALKSMLSTSLLTAAETLARLINLCAFVPPLEESRFISLFTVALAKVDVHPWLKISFLRNEPKSKKSQTIANQLEAQTQRVILAQKTNPNIGSRKTGNLSKLFKGFQRDSKLFKGSRKLFFIFPSIAFSASIIL